MRGQKKRERIFRKFAHNLNNIRSHPNIVFEVYTGEDLDFDNGYVCPLCYRWFPEDDIVDSAKTGLTLEHVPPDSLGGKPLILTCKTCNSNSGNQLDSSLLQKLKVDEFSQKVLGSNLDTRVKIGNEINVAATIFHSGTEKYKVILDSNPKRTHPEHVEKLWQKLRQNQKPDFTMSFHEKYQNRLAQVALLRIGYLLAFNFFGYGFLMQNNLGKVRSQINEPEKEILPSLGTSSISDLPDDLLGISIVTSPKELQSFLVVFDLKTDFQTTRHAVILPGPDDETLKVYRLMSNEKPSVNFQCLPIPKDNYLKNREDCFLSWEIWRLLQIQ